jgi:hypothetical protein
MGWNAIGRENNKPNGEDWANSSLDEQKTKLYHAEMDEGRKRVIGIMPAIMAGLHMQTADDLFGGPQGSPRTDQLIAASIQWAERIMRKIDSMTVEN